MIQFQVNNIISLAEQLADEELKNEALILMEQVSEIDNYTSENEKN